MTRRTARHTTGRAVVVAAALTALGACSTTAADLPLPGSSLRGPSYAVSAQIDDALNLAVGAPVKVDGITVGRVDEVTVRDFTASISMDLKQSTSLHEGASIRLQSTTPLGELYVDVTDAEDGPLLHDGDAIDAASVTAAPTVEDTLASASMLVNGGGLGQLETIVDEANRALGGREGTARELLGRLDRTARSFNDSSDDIDATLDALAEVSTILHERDATIDRALTDVTPAAKVLSRQTDDLARLLRSVDDLGVTTTRVVGETRADLLTTLDQIGPVLDELTSLRTELGPGLQSLITLAAAIDKGVPGDYLNVALYFQPELSVGLPTLPVLEDLVPAPRQVPLALPEPGEPPLGAVEDLGGAVDDLTGDLTGLRLGPLLDQLLGAS